MLPSELYNADTAQKSEMMDVLGGEKKLDDMVNRLDTQPECDGRTDRPPDSSYVLVSRVSMPTHGNSRMAIHVSHVSSTQTLSVHSRMSGNGQGHDQLATS